MGTKGEIVREKRVIRFVLAFALVWFSGNRAPVHAEGIKGVSKMKLSGPITRELSAKARRVALEDLAGPLLDWVHFHTDVPWDTSNAIYDYHFNKLLSSCAEKTKENSSFEGYIWNYTLQLSDADRHEVVVRHNARCDSMALAYWQRTQEEMSTNQYAASFRSGVASLFFAMGHIGAQLEVPDTTGRSLRIAAQEHLQDLLNRTKLSVDNMVIEGKPGFAPTQAVTVSVTIDGTPVDGFPLNAVVSGGKKVCSAETNDSGTFSFKDTPVPYVPHGTFLYILPSFEGIIDVLIPFLAEDLGLRVTSQQKQQVIYKLTPPIYSLSYNVSAVSDIEVPSSFSTDNFLMKFLTDTCFLAHREGGQAPDLTFDILSQVSKYTNDKTFQLIVKIDCRIVILPKKNQHEPVERAFTLIERTYDLDKNISMGLFFWEAATELKKNVRQILLSL